MASSDKEPQKILLSVDASQQARRAVEYYAENVHKPGNKVIVLHIIELPEMSEAMHANISPGVLQKLWEEEIQKSKTLEKELKTLLDEKGVTDAELRVEGGGNKPGQAIVKSATDNQCAMIVMGTRGLGKIRRTLMGSVSDYVVHHAHCPVLVCRAPDQH